MMDKNPKKRIWPDLYCVALMNVERQASGKNIGRRPSMINIRPNATTKILSNYLFFVLFRYLKNSESASSTIISSLVLKLFL